VKNPELFFAARDDDGTLMGFYFFEPRDSALFYGFGMRPDLTGRGLGEQFVLAGLEFAPSTAGAAWCSMSRPSTNAPSACIDASVSTRPASMPRQSAVTARGVHRHGKAWLNATMIRRRRSRLGTGSALWGCVGHQASASARAGARSLEASVVHAVPTASGAAAPSLPDACGPGRPPGGR
jgi:hypothetical protein